MGELSHYDAVLASLKKPNFHSLKGIQLQQRIEEASIILESCALCERRCSADRSSGQAGHCGVLEARISTMFDHWGEEHMLVPSYTIFFAGCTFDCVFCQNWDISTDPTAGNALTAKYVAGVLENKEGVRNVNWVGGDPTPNLPFILEVLQLTNAALPQIWNSNMYLTEQSMHLLDGAIDLYLTDFKHGSDGCAKRLSGIDRYWEVTTRNHLLAAGQCDVIARHLVMPNHVQCCSKPILDWLAENLPNAKVNVMAQYRPLYQAHDHMEIARPITGEEHGAAHRCAGDLGLNLL